MHEFVHCWAPASPLQWGPSRAGWKEWEDDQGRSWPGQRATGGLPVRPPDEGGGVHLGVGLGKARSHRHSGHSADRFICILPIYYIWWPVLSNVLGLWPVASQHNSQWIKATLLPLSPHCCLHCVKRNNFIKIWIISWEWPFCLCACLYLHSTSTPKISD